MTETFLVIIAVSLRILSNPLANVLQKQLTSKGSNPLIINFITYLLLSVFCLLISFFMNWPVLKQGFWLYSVLGGIAGALGNSFLIKALEKGDLSVLGPINSYKSVIGIIASIFLLFEIPNQWGILGIALIIYGSYFVLDTTQEKFSWTLFRKKEIQYRLWAMILTALEAVFIKKVILASSTTIAFISWCVAGAVFSFLLLFVYKLNMKKESQQVFHASNLLKYGLLIVCIGVMQFTTNYSFDHMPVGYALSLFQLSAVVSIIFGYRFFNEQDIRKKIIGSVIMVIGSTLIILFKSR